MKSIFPKVGGARLAQTNPGDLVVFDWLKSSRFGISTILPNQDTAIVIISPMIAGAVNLAKIQGVPVITYGKNWSIAIEEGPEAFHFPEEEADLQSGSLLFTGTGPIAIVVGSPSNRRLYYEVATGEVRLEAPNFDGAALRWNVETMEGSRRQTLCKATAASSVRT
jgi:hypothetical protein